MSLGEDTLTAGVTQPVGETKELLCLLYTLAGLAAQKSPFYWKTLYVILQKALEGFEQTACVFDNSRLDFGAPAC